MWLAFFCSLFLAGISAILLNYNSKGGLISAGFSLIFLLFGIGVCIMVRLDEIEYAITQTKV